MNRSQQAYEYIRRKIKLSEWMPGHALKEENLADRLNMSRTPVRRAFDQLEEEGLINRSDNRGAVVNKKFLDKKEFQDLVDFFEMMVLQELQRMQTREYDFPSDSLKEPILSMEDHLIDQAKLFLEEEERFWSVVINQAGNSYSQMLMTQTLHLAFSQEGYIDDILAASRPEKLKHLKQLARYLEENDYPYARREARIMFNQIVLNIFQGAR